MSRLLSIVLLGALVAGCAPSAVPSSMATSLSQKLHAPSALNYPLLYVADLGTNQVIVDSYPQGEQKFVISGFGSANGVCRDVNGNVYVSDGHNGEVVEFEYASRKRLRVLKDPGYYLGGCAVETVSEDVAVAIQPAGSSAGGIAIFRGGRGKPTNYTSNSTYFARDCTYDSKGNLYVDGTASKGGVFVAELARKSHSFLPISLSRTIVAAGGLQWDQAHNELAIDDQGVGYKGSTVYEFAIDGSTATEENETPLKGSTDVVGFTLVQYSTTASRLIGANTGKTPSVMYWNYPKGGKATKTITGFTEPVSVVIASEPSLAH